MKKNSKIKVTVLLPMLIIGILSITFSCNTATKTEDTKVVAEDLNEDKFNTIKSEKDAQFLVNATEMNFQAIKLGELAQVNGNLEDIKNHGKMMEAFHKKSLVNLTNLASEKSISIPTTITEEGQGNYEALFELKGAAFDKDYSTLMLEHHKNAVEVYETASRTCEDVDIKDWASSELSQLRSHLDESMKIQKSVN